MSSNSSCEKRNCLIKNKQQNKNSNNTIGPHPPYKNKGGGSVSLKHINLVKKENLKSMSLVTHYIHVFQMSGIIQHKTEKYMDEDPYQYTLI